MHSQQQHLFVISLFGDVKGCSLLEFSKLTSGTFMKDQV